MKRIATITAILFLPLVVVAYTSPGRSQGYVSDFANVMNVDDVQSIENRLRAFGSSTGDEVAVVTVKTLGNDETIETYATKLFAEWGIGKKTHDNGLLILVAPNEREVRIEVGYGLEGNITDLVSNNIIQNVMIPAFKTGNFSTGVSGAVDAVVGVISGSEDAKQYLDPKGIVKSSGSKINFYALFFVGVMVLNILARVLGRTKSWWLGGVIGAVIGAVVGLVFGFISVGVIAIVVLTVLGLIFDFIVSKNPPGSGPGKGGGIWPIFFGGNGSGGNGIGGGGFGGFGGGMSGGGGASGRW